MASAPAVRREARRSSLHSGELRLPYGLWLTAFVVLNFSFQLLAAVQHYCEVWFWFFAVKLVFVNTHMGYLFFVVWKTSRVLRRLYASKRLAQFYPTLWTVWNIDEIIHLWTVLDDVGSGLNVSKLLGLFKSVSRFRFVTPLDSQKVT